MHRKQHMSLSIYDDVRWLTFSNILTGSRITLAPCVVGAIYFQYWTIAFGILLFSAATDFFDGYIARLLKDQTTLGTVLDPIADKIFLSVSFGALALLPSPLLPIPQWFFVLILIRETVLLIGTYSVMRVSKKFIIAPSWWGKATTCCQLLFILWLFICYFLGWSPRGTYFFSLVVLTLLTIFSLLHYVHRGYRYLVLAYRVS